LADKDREIARLKEETSNQFDIIHQQEKELLTLEEQVVRLKEFLVEEREEKLTYACQIADEQGLCHGCDNCEDDPKKAREQIEKEVEKGMKE
jgi:hypothetical protein